MAQGVGSCRVSKGVSTLPHGRLRGAFFVLVTGLSLLRLNSLGVSGPEKLFKTGYASTGASFIRPARRPLLLGRELPEPLRRVLLDKPAQGSGPDPDKQLTPTAQNSQEFDVATPGLDKVARIAFVSNGVDEWVNSAEPGPNDPPPPEDDPNHHPDGQIDRYGVSDTGFNIWLMRHDGSAQYALTDMPGDERDPAYDPGGTILAFVNNQTGTYQIYTIDILNKTIRQITSDPGNKSSPTWSADGTMIAYATDINGPSNRDILRVRTTGVGTPVVLVATPSDEFEPMWSPNGNWILFTRNDGGITHIWRMDAWGASQEQLTNGGGDPTASDKNPAWRQDGLATEFAFASNRLTDISDAQKDYNIWTLGASGEIAGATPVLHSNTDPTDTKDDIMPAFSPLLAPVPSAAPVRIFFTSYRMDKIGPPEGTAEPDIWGLVVDDARPPVLLELPTVSNRNLNPGDDIIVYARPYDDETGVQTVVAWFKDPDSMDDDAQGLDHKFGGPPVTPTGNKNYEGSTTCPGPYFAEREFDRVGSVQLLDDGDLANSGDQVAGDGIYSGIWTTPSIPSDFIIDIELTDNSGNFINFDDVYGFSTVRFAPRANVLFVNDYCEGQEFLAQAGLNNEDFAGYSVESYFTHNESNGGPGAYYNTLNGPYNESYDLWRVICRGAPDLQTLSYYGPSAELQLTPDLEDFREVPVANRCVFWAAPHTGDVWAADGTIVEAATQALLTNFVERGGRLAVAGMDIAWALTMDGQVANSFLTNVLGANFVRDDDGTANRNRDFTASIEWQLEGIGGDPVADDTWTQGPTDHWTDDTTDDMCSDIVQNNVSTDGASFSPYPDVIAPAGSVVVYNYTGPGSGVAAVRREDPASLARVVYFAFPFEALHRRYDSGSGCACRNKRSKLMHMTLCYLRTGGFQGRVVDRDGLRPIRDPEPIVTVQDYDNETILYAQRCQKDGRYVIGGLPPNWYVLKATRPGYKIDKLNRGVCHGGLSYPVQDFVITQAQPGAIQGTVTSLATGEPIANVTITAVSATDPLGAKPIPPVVTAADGTYVLPNLPVDDYTVTADGSTATPPYGSDTADVTVVPGGTVTQDFQLPAAPGTLLVTVKDSDTNALLADVTVEAVLNNVVVGSGLTNTSGQASLDLPPGTYNL
ncbi:MAG: carboxypeptidase regulatory-like domain-containing protein, partial [Candidatus Zipacnadales bacterium]